MTVSEAKSQAQARAQQAQDAEEFTSAVFELLKAAATEREERIQQQLDRLGFQDEGVDEAVNDADDVWGEAFAYLLEAYCVLWSEADKTGELPNSELDAMEQTLHFLLRMCRDSSAWRRSMAAEKSQ